ncbi:MULTISPECIES: hypothetical protein [Streptomyces]|nr:MULTISPECIES: hypothetical protein [Streptomyces]RSS89334.1 hypothetical protein EF904_32465 [Streptomyces sp. WAC05950]KOU25456.1 hypothetical protein ADK49_05945 [Streptomyces sp. WM6349]KOU98959.1 hypothetical protein ADK91_28995 [Streptomyces sp. XY511]KOV52796.1 hypothetical protein ADK98_05630 [Streptomyces sp. H036]MBP2342037.1 hypothetical protein [Streptomyces virginiae]
MATDPVLRQGPDSTDLVLRVGPVGPTWNALTSAGPALFTPLALGALTLLVALGMALAGARASTVFVVVGVIAGLEYLIGWLALASSRARDILRVEFAPAGVPASLRLVRGAGPDDWLPVKTLREVRLTHKVVEPYPGDYKPAVSTLTLELALRGVREQLTLPFDGDPQRLADSLKALLGPAGVVVMLRTERSTRDRPQRNSGWTSGGSASANSGGG